MRTRKETHIITIKEHCTKGRRKTLQRANAIPRWCWMCQAILNRLRRTRRLGKDGKKHGTRYDSPQTVLALKTFRDDTSITAFYGFSGGGYNLWWILSKLTPDERKRIELVVVVGVDTDKPQADYDKSKFAGADWDLIYRPNHPRNHMFEPEALLLDEQRVPFYVRCEVKDW